MELETTNDMLNGPLATDITDKLWRELRSFADKSNEHCSGTGCPGFIHFDALKQKLSEALSTRRPIEFGDAAVMIAKSLSGGAPISAVARTVFDVCVLIQSAAKEDWDRRCDARNRKQYGEEWYAKNHRV